MIEQFRNGNEHSFNLLYKEFYRSLYYFALKIVQEEQEAEDIVTESMVKLWQQRIHFSQLAEVKSFLFITTQRAALNAIRNRQRHSQKELLIAKAVESENTDSFFDQLVLTELVSIIASQVEQLPKLQREVFKMTYFEGLSTEEIATSLEMSPDAVYTNRRRALQALRLYFRQMDVWFYLLFIRLFFNNF